jgi:hypothetical protein
MFWEKARLSFAEIPASVQKASPRPQEQSIYVLTYNLTRVLNIVGVPAVLEAING